MSKRLSDSDVWKKAWFYDLEPKYKLFWFYILSDCDAAGVWAVNMKLAENIVGAKLEKDVLLEKFRDQIQVINGGSYWFVRDFIKFQYGYPVSENAKMRSKLQELLQVRGLDLDNLNTVSIGYQYSIDTVKDKDIDKDKDKDREEGGVGETKTEEEIQWKKIINEHYPQLLKMRQPLTYTQHNEMVEKYGKKAVRMVYERMQNWPELTKKRTSANLTARKFLREEAS